MPKGKRRKRRTHSDASLLRPRPAHTSPFSRAFIAFAAAQYCYECATAQRGWRGGRPSNWGTIFAAMRDGRSLSIALQHHETVIVSRWGDG